MPVFYLSAEQRLSRLVNSGIDHLLAGGLIGLEKECLRVSPDGKLSQTPHPAILGSPLTHPYITTDYSEALIECITPPAQDIGTALNFLRDTQKFVYDNLDQEILWSTSMPCILEGTGSIPIARYGSSNAGLMKTVYRRGLGHRYGHLMQVIAGVHFNYSLHEEFWPSLQDQEKTRCAVIDFRSENYLALIRNLQRLGWLIPYLFGSSPAVCKSFLDGKPTDLQEFDESTYYYPHATSLRLGDIGYQNKKGKGVGVKVCYDSLSEYIKCLTRAIETSCPRYEKIGVVVDGRYEQLNANLLQIENEYYSTVRPKQIPDWMEKPTLALKRRGIRYIELRSLDVNVFDPLGINAEQLHFLEAFLVFCLLLDSPPIGRRERREIDANAVAAAHKGRKPRLKLQRYGRNIALQSWAADICDAMCGVCKVLDAHSSSGAYSASLKVYRQSIEDPGLTPSARILDEMKARGEGFHYFAKRQSLSHQRYFGSFDLSEQMRLFFRDQADLSHRRQGEIEVADNIPFGEFLAGYFAQR